MEEGDVGESRAALSLHAPTDAALINKRRPRPMLFIADYLPLNWLSRAITIGETFSKISAIHRHVEPLAHV
jgi:hypothetical protein